MTNRRPAYRIERMDELPRSSASERSATRLNGSGDARLNDIVAGLQELKQLITPAQREATDVFEAYKTQLAEIFELRLEFDRMKKAIESTKAQLAAIRRLESEGRSMRRVNSELDEVVVDTERATTSILSATEEIEGQIRSIRDTITDPTHQARVEIVLQKVVALYESCSFHDVTGQRISKIVGVLKYLEERVQAVIDAWAALDAFRGFASSSAVPGSAAAASVAIPGPKHVELLHGPRLPKDSGHASQDDIDAMFD
jgi:chemotaxis protein CheZ